MGKLDDLDREVMEKQIEKRVGKGMTWIDAINDVFHVSLPPVPVIAFEAIAADVELGRDFNGSTLYSERVAYLNEHGYTGSKRALMLRLLQTANSVRNRVRNEEMEAARQS